MPDPSGIAPRQAASPGETPRTPSSGYMPSGRLTRAPHALTDIDLNADDISHTGFAGEVVLTLLIEPDGSVADVLVPTDDADAAAFAELVAARFRSARFSPGEIDGRPVRSELRIKVVSERRPSEQQP